VKHPEHLHQHDACARKNAEDDHRGSPSLAAVEPIMESGDENSGRHRQHRPPEQPFLHLTCVEDVYRVHVLKGAEPKNGRGTKAGCQEPCRYGSNILGRQIAASGYSWFCGSAIRVVMTTPHAGSRLAISLMMWNCDVRTSSRPRR
jgi:hypothetical protein